MVMRLTAFFLLISFSGFCQDTYKNIYIRHAWKARDAWQRADELIRLLGISPGSEVADIGCHEGYMTFKLSKIVGNDGQVYAVDINQSKVDKVKTFAEKNNITNIKVIKGDYDDPKLPAAKLDAVIILDTYHEMDDHDEILKHVKASLKPGGKLVICEPIAEERRKSSRADQERKHELALQFALEDLAKAGFKVTFQKDPFIDRVKEKGDKMWVVVATIE
jgi:ubiquinone/menaquinone biosynthesis C-methylase UbiE